MNILVVGSGGMEHALAWNLSQSPLTEKLYCAPGNPGTMSIAENVPIPDTDIPRIATAAARSTSATSHSPTPASPSRSPWRWAPTRRPSSVP